ncbi:MAG: 2-C-methyl-D-erythritol 4-phosphate cytidylyltransferase [Mycobacteriales bacterium]
MNSEQSGGRVAVVVAAAGRGERLGGGTAKALRPIDGAPMLVHTMRSLAAATSVDLMVVVAPASDLAAVRDVLASEVVVVPGGATRAESVRCALAVLPDDVAVVLVHDAARPFVPAQVVEAVIAAVRAGHHAVIPVIAVADTVKRLGSDGRVVETLPRHELYAVQTPQGFLRSLLDEAHRDLPMDATDDAVLVEALGRPVWTVPGADLAFKVTRPVDLMLAESVLSQLRSRPT